MLTIDLQRCEGCGACVEVCPQGALYLVEGMATVDTSLCDECRRLPAGSQAACIVACPLEAIAIIPEAVPIVAPPVRPSVPEPEPRAIRIQTEQDTLPLRAKVLPVLGAMVSWAGREILPTLADSLLRSLERWATEGQTKSMSRGAVGRPPASRNEGGKGRRRRQRRRGS